MKKKINVKCINIMIIEKGSDNTPKVKCINLRKRNQIIKVNNFIII